MRAPLLFCLFSLMCFAVALPAAVAADDPAWLTDFAKAKETAKKEKKVILADFTGSDWCGWCIKLKGEVFDKDEFKSWAAKNVILLELDYPRKKELPAELKAQNDKLAQEYGIQGYPTILFLDADGEKIGRFGYLPGGPAAWTAEADKILANKPKKSPKGLGDSLVDSMAAAKESNLPLLVMLTNDSKADLTRTTPLIANAEFTKAADGRLVAVKVPFPAPKDMAEAEKAALDEIVKKYRPNGSTYLLIDVVKGKALLSKPIAFTNDSALMAAVTAMLPKPVYSGEWLEDYAKAAELSKTTGRPMLLDFTGSDWCGWCIKLDKEVFAMDEFKKYAKENFILVKLDFPKTKPQSAELKKQNQGLSQKYQIAGFPTVLVVDANGNKLGTTGYVEGGPAAFNGELKKILTAAGK